MKLVFRRRIKLKDDNLKNIFNKAVVSCDPTISFVRNKTYNKINFPKYRLAKWSV